MDLVSHNPAAHPSCKYVYANDCSDKSSDRQAIIEGTQILIRKNRSFPHFVRNRVSHYFGLLPKGLLVAFSESQAERSPWTVLARCIYGFRILSISSCIEPNVEMITPTTPCVTENHGFGHPFWIHQTNLYDIIEILFSWAHPWHASIHGF